MVILSEAVTQQISTIRDDNTHGASWLAREALRVVGACALEPVDVTTAALLERINGCVGALVEARPEMAPIRFWVERLREDVERNVAADGDPTSAREAILRRVDQLVQQSEQAGQRVIENAVARLPVGSTVFTASYSQTVVNACRLACDRGTLRALLVAESVDAAGRCHGRLLATALGAVSATVEVIPDDLAPGRVAEADLVWLGADTVLPDGSVLNGTPSLAVAAAAVVASRPVEIVAEAAKVERPTGSYDEERHRAELVHVPEGMDRLPAELIAAVVTENGVIGGRADVVARIAELLVARKETMAVIETATGGRICDQLTDRPGSSAWFAGGVVAYSGASVRGLAGVSDDLVKTHGAVSAETAQALADGARSRFDAAWGVGETGIAGPQTGRRSSKPAGLAYLAISGPNDRRRVVETTTGEDNRVGNKRAFALAALRLLLTELESAEDRRS